MSRQLPKRGHVNQGKCKRDKWGYCRACGAPSGIRCAKCRHWRCRDCIKLRKAPGKVGVYIVHCSPKCILRQSVPATLPAELRPQELEPDDVWRYGPDQAFLGPEEAPGDPLAGIAGSTSIRPLGRCEECFGSVDRGYWCARHFAKTTS